MASLAVTTPPSTEPITLAELKLQARVDTDDADSLLNRLMTAARQWVEAWLDKALITQTITLKLDAFPSVIKLPKGPVQSVTSISYLDSNGTSQVWSASNYQLDTGKELGKIAAKEGVSTPSTQLATFDTVTVVYVAGYGDAADDVPEPIRHALLLLATHWYNEWTASGPVELKEAPFGVEALLSTYRRHWV